MENLGNHTAAKILSGAKISSTDMPKGNVAYKNKYGEVVLSEIDNVSYKNGSLDLLLKNGTTIPYNRTLISDIDTAA